jgi:hypothetical protein
MAFADAGANRTKNLCSVLKRTSISEPLRITFNLEQLKLIEFWRRPSIPPDWSYSAAANPLVKGIG